MATFCLVIGSKLDWKAYSQTVFVMNGLIIPDDYNLCRYRIGPFEVESALIEHPAVAESAVVSSPDVIRGAVSFCVTFVSLYVFYLYCIDIEYCIRCPPLYVIHNYSITIES